MQGLQQKLLYPFGRISDSPMLWLLDMSLILPSLFLSLNRHALSQTHYQNQVTNVQRAYHILTCKDWLMLWQTSIIYSGKHDFLDWIISATIHLENPANKGSLSGNINYRVSFSMSNMLPTSLINLCLACCALGTDENQIKSGNFVWINHLYYNM